MKCPSEFTWSVYVDGELSPDELRGAEMHLVACRDCRGRVVALQEEVAALAGALFERAESPVVAQGEAAPARELAWGLPLAVAAVTAVIAIAGLLIELRLPGVLDLLNPKRLMGVYEMAFDAVFMLRRRLPELTQAVASLGAIAAFSALGCAVLQALSRRLARTSSFLLLVFASSLAAPEIARAVDIRLDQDTRVAAGETVSETLVCTGDVVTIDGTVDGDLVVGAERITMRGRVTGNFFAFGDEVEIEGEIEGSVMVIGDDVRLAAEVARSATLLGERLAIDDEARVGRDVAVFGEGVTIAGSAARDVAFAGDWIEVRSEIARDLHVLGADRVTLLDGARIGRDLRAHLWGKRDIVDQAPGAEVGGEVKIVRESVVHEHYLAHYRKPGFYVRLLVAAAAAFVFGLLVYLLDPRVFAADLPDTRGFLRSLGVGFLVLVAGPILLVLIGLTVIGLPVAIFGLFLLISSVYAAWVLAAGLVGQTLVKPTGTSLGAFAPSLLVGVLVVGVVSALPFVGAAVRILAVLFGLGCLVERVRGLQALNLRGIRG